MKCLNTHKLIYWTDWDYNILTNVETVKMNKKQTYNDIIIMADTETTKADDNVKMKNGKWSKVNNYVVCWSLAMIINDDEYVIYGRRPSELTECIEKIQKNLKGKQTFVYFHNLAYDYQFLRKFFVRDFGQQTDQLNIKPLYPLYIEYKNGIILKDSLLLAQRKLEKWAEDLDVIHKKAVGKWDYDKKRTQTTGLTEDELLYIQNDVLAGVECLYVMCQNLNVQIGELPYTNTGIVRREIKTAGQRNGANDAFKKVVPNKKINDILEKAYHGGFTHANRDCIGWKKENVICYDFSSSYPYVILSERFPVTKFEKIKSKIDLAYIIENSFDYAFILKIVLKNIQIKDETVMPCISESKCGKLVNEITDNGRILYADYLDTYITEQELLTILKQYNFDYVLCDVYVSKKDYLPKWLTDKVYDYFTKKTQLKDGDDPIMYMLQKGMLNSIYGLMCEHTCREEIVEDMTANEYLKMPGDYDNYKKSRTNVLLYQWGVWITAYAQHNLYELGACCDEWVYCDTDSVYGIGWDNEKLNAYNNKCKEMLESRGYGAVKNENTGKYYWLGVAEFDGEYSEFKTLGAKRYCCRDKKTGKLKITVAGVPKKTGAECLKDNIDNFKKGFIFDGLTTGKKTHYYIYADSIFTDEQGNECGDCIDLVPCDYVLDTVSFDFEKLMEKEIFINVYE